MCFHPLISWDEEEKHTVRTTYLVCWSSQLTRGYNAVSFLIQVNSYHPVTGSSQEETLHRQGARRAHILDFNSQDSCQLWSDGENWELLSHRTQAAIAPAVHLRLTDVV